MAQQFTTYHCPSCNGPLVFSPSLGKLECRYCHNTFSVQEIERINREKTEQAAEAFRKDSGKEDPFSFSGETSPDLQGFRCPSCQAEFFTSATTGATTCPYCGAPNIVPGQFGTEDAPESIVPFRMSRADAIEKLKEHFSRKFLLPKVFKSSQNLDEIKGLYVPFWLFDGTELVEGRFEGRRSKSYRSGDYIITNTDHFDVYRRGSVDFRMVPADGSKKVPDDYMDSIEPYAYENLVPFSNAYLPGFFANKHDVSDREVFPRVEERCRNSAYTMTMSTIQGYSSVIDRGSQLSSVNVSSHYVLLPVWLLKVRWKQKDYFYAMNGQTGKMVGDLPVDRRKLNLTYWLTVLAVTLLLGAAARESIGYLLLNLLYGF